MFSRNFIVSQLLSILYQRNARLSRKKLSPLFTRVYRYIDVTPYFTRVYDIVFFFKKGSIFLDISAEYDIIYLTIEKRRLNDMKITIDLNKIFRKVKSQKRGWVIITSEDRDWDFGKPLKTNDLQEIVKKIKKTVDMGVKV
jgi:hypothetical protein